MNATEFSRKLADEDFTAATAGRYEPNRINDDHSHPFEVLGLVTAGQMSISTGGEVQHCGPGDVFVMRLGETHREEVGPDGCDYLYGSREA